MKSVILFARYQEFPIRNSPFQAALPGIPGLVIRAEVVKMDIDEALNNAYKFQRVGEIVLNTIRIP